MKAYEMAAENKRLREEVERLRHDIERHIAMASELATENERLRADLADCRMLLSKYSDSAQELREACDEKQRCIDSSVQAQRTFLAEVDSLRDILRRQGFVPCDISACNCGAWHHRYGLPERMRELEDLLAEAGHPLGNKNGNLLRGAVRDLISERDALRSTLERLREALESIAGGEIYPVQVALDALMAELEETK